MAFQSRGCAIFGFVSGEALVKQPQGLDVSPVDAAIPVLVPADPLGLETRPVPDLKFICPGEGF